MSARYIKVTRRACGGRIEYRPAATVQSLACPHCAQPILALAQSRKFPWWWAFPVMGATLFLTVLAVCLGVPQFVWRHHKAYVELRDQLVSVRVDVEEGFTADSLLQKRKALLVVRSRYRRELALDSFKLPTAISQPLA